MVDVKKIPAYATGYEWLGSTKRHGSYGIMIFLGLMVHIIQMLRYWFGTLDTDIAYYALHTVLAIIFLVLIDKEDKNIYAIWLAYMLLPLIVFYFRGLLINNMQDMFAGKIGKSFLGLYLSTFMYPLWMLYGCSQSDSKIAKFILNSYLVIAVIFFVGALIETPSFARAAGFLGKQTGVPVEPHTIMEGVTEMYTKTRDFIVQTPAKIREGWERQIEYATGGYYEGKVEENVREQLGVYLENLQSAETEFDDKSDVIVWGTIKARTLDEEKPIAIQLKCAADADEEKEGKTGELIPKSLQQFVIKTFEEEDFSCKFPKETLDGGSHNIKFSATFNFRTMAYLKTYFMDQERRRSMIREEIDIFKEYGITDTSPIATFTNGPVKIGAETTKSLPAGVEKDKTVRLGVTIENQWQGTIKEVTNTVIEVPDGIEIENCDVESNFLENKEGFNRYSVNLKIERFNNIDSFKSFNCILKFLDNTKILGATPITTRYYRVTTDYIYELGSYMSINIKEPLRKEIETEGTFMPSSQWFRVKATSFSVGDRGAYGGGYADNDLYAALPARIEGDRLIELRYNSRSLRPVPIVDIGPWFIDDNYWDKDGSPFAQKNEGKYRTSLQSADGVSDTPTNKVVEGKNISEDKINGAGIDLSPGVFKNLGITGVAEVEWRFVGKATPTFKIWPVDNPKITSDYGPRSLNGKKEYHRGIDIDTELGDPIKSVADGIVESTCEENGCGGYGLTIIIKHDENLYTRYSHLSSVSVKSKAKVKEGDVVGLSGSTGTSTGTHLDFRVYTSNNFGSDSGVDPISYLPAIT